MKSSNIEVAKVQDVILEIMRYIDKVCRENHIIYYIMGGTALGAIRHGGFIPWDDDLDIFMTPDQYQLFVKAFNRYSDERFIIQEWRAVPNYIEYAKVRKNGTTFIEHNFKNRKDLHQGIYVDIMLLHKVKDNPIIERLVYFKSKFVMLYALSQRGWTPKSRLQSMAVYLLKHLPAEQISTYFYKAIYKYDNLEKRFKYCYWLTPAKFRAGLFDAGFFGNPVDIAFESINLLGSARIKDYLRYRYGDYMKLPSEEQQQASVHAEIYDVDKDFSFYLS